MTMMLFNVYNQNLEKHLNQAIIASAKPKSMEALKQRMSQYGSIVQVITDLYETYQRVRLPLIIGCGWSLPLRLIPYGKKCKKKNQHAMFS